MTRSPRGRISRVKTHSGFSRAPASDVVSTAEARPNLRPKQQFTDSFRNNVTWLARGTCLLRELSNQPCILVTPIRELGDRCWGPITISVLRPGLW
jgi:hypothetical protein